MIDPPTGVDWNRYGPWGVWGVVFAIIGALVRGQWTNLVMRAIESEEGRVRMKAVSDKMYANRIRENDALLAKAIDAARENGDKADAITATQLMQGLVLRDVERATQQMPKITEALHEVAETNSRLSDTMQVMAIAFARMEEREREREKRWHDVSPNPGQRRGDYI